MFMNLEWPYVPRQGSGNILASFPGFSLEIYFQMVHNSLARYDTPSLHTAIKILSGKPG